MAALAVIVGCGSTGISSAGRGSDQLEALPDTPDALIQMRRGGCAAGRCPVYGVSVFMDGTVTYDGRANVAVIGQRRAKLSSDRVNELVVAIESMDFLDSAQRCCVCSDATGSPMVILDYRPGSVQKTVLHDEGCRSAPPAMSALEQAIDRVTEVARWTAPVVINTPPADSIGDGSLETPPMTVALPAAGDGQAN